MRKVERGVLYFPGELGAAVKVIPADGRKFTYKEQRAAVDGLIESVIPAVRGHRVWANEEGLVFGLQENYRTAKVANMKIYALNGCPKDWKLCGRILETFVQEASSTDDADHVTISQAVRS